MEKNKELPTITFRTATIEEIMEVVTIKQVINDEKFEEWFTYNYKISNKENVFLEELIALHRTNLYYYSEQKLTIKFLAPILNKINFHFDNVNDWYGAEISCELNGYKLSGKPDLIVATGISTPKIPYFFMQEYKKSLNPTGHPEEQVLASMLAAMTLNNENSIIGSYVIGAIWRFIILEKLENENYQYYVSHAFDGLNLKSLRQIYTNLQAVKFLYCK